MNRSLIIAGVLAVAAGLWGLQSRRMEALRASVERLRLEAGDPPASGSTEGPGREARPLRSKSRPPSDPRLLPRRPARQPGREELATGGESTGTKGDELKARQLAHRLELGEPRRRQLAPMLTRYAMTERRATERLLESAREFLLGIGDDADLWAALRTRKRVWDETGALRDALGKAELQVLTDFEAAQQRNALQLLANEEFEAWKLHLDFDGAVQDAYAAFYSTWEARLRNPVSEETSLAEFEARMAGERRRTLERFAAILSREDFEVMQAILEAGSGSPAEEPPAPK